MSAAPELSGKRVLVTRPGDGAEAFAAQLRAAGAEPILAPTIAIGPPDDPAAARKAAAHAGGYAWVAFTSRNGVDAFCDARSGLSDDAAGSLAELKIAAIGPKTAAALEARGLRADLVPTTFVNEAVATALLTHTAPGDRVLIYAAQDARDVLALSLRAFGRRVDVVAAYRTHFVADPELAAKTERADIVTFTSASTVLGFVAALPGAAQVLRDKTVAAIGPITAQTAREAGIRVDVVPAAFTVEGLLQALAATTAALA
jgi:uroporphyrinogen-III synthase